MPVKTLNLLRTDGRPIELHLSLFERWVNPHSGENRVKRKSPGTAGNSFRSRQVLRRTRNR